MNRIVGLETEYGCLISEDQAQSQADAWPVKVKNYLFRKCHVGAIDLHYRDYEEPPGNGGFLLNGGRLYLDMGHLEYSSPECLNLRDLVSFDIAGDLLLHQALTEMGVEDQVAFLKNNVDHHTGATFGCHENYLMRREAQFTPEVSGLAAGVPGDPADICRRRSSWAGESAGFRFRVTRPTRSREFSDQPAGRPHRERHLSMGAIQPGDHQCSRRAAGRLSEISPAASVDRRLQHEPVCDRLEGRNHGLRTDSCSRKTCCRLTSRCVTRSWRPARFRAIPTANGSSKWMTAPGRTR